MAKRESQDDHDNMIKLTISHFKSMGYRNIKAHIPGWDTPMKLTWEETGQSHIPDVTGDGSPNVIIEVETVDTIDDEHTKDQWTSFAAYAKQQGEEFWVAVPEGSEQAAERRLGELGIVGNILAL